LIISFLLVNLSKSELPQRSYPDFDKALGSRRVLSFCHLFLVFKKRRKKAQKPLYELVRIRVLIIK